MDEESKAVGCRPEAVGRKEAGTPRVVRVVYVRPAPGGVECLECGGRARVVRTMPVERGVRVRYVKCGCGWTGKAVEEAGGEGDRN